jgi:hypothetical protein
MVGVEDDVLPLAGDVESMPGPLVLGMLSSPMVQSRVDAPRGGGERRSQAATGFRPTAKTEQHVISEIDRVVVE